MPARTSGTFHPPDSGGRSAAARSARIASTRRRDTGARARRWTKRAVARRLLALARQRSLVGGGGEFFSKAPECARGVVRPFHQGNARRTGERHAGLRTHSRAGARRPRVKMDATRARLVATGGEPPASAGAANAGFIG